MTERKKLGEMGVVFRNAVTDEVVQITFTPDELRELVRMSINKWEAFKYSVMLADGRIPTFGELCEDEGL